MVTLTETHRQRQERQFASFERWRLTEGDVEGPILFKTYQQPSQQRRLEWIKGRVVGATVDVGCNCGWSTSFIGAIAGCDINMSNVQIAQVFSPDIDFRLANAVHLPYGDNAFETVVLGDMLEHGDFEKEVPQVIAEAKRVASRKVIVTLPDGSEDTPDATCFKHRWLCDHDRLTKLLGMLEPSVSAYTFEGFICIEALL